MQSASKETVGQMLAAYGAYTEAMKKAGVHGRRRAAAADLAATTVRVANGKTEVLDGPYAETKEQLGGYYMIDVPDLDAALSWAARCPGASHGAIEVRPIWVDVAIAAMPPRWRPGCSARAAEAVARRSYGKLVAFLAARTRDVAGAEDALSDAFAAALVGLAGARHPGQARRPG